MSSIRRLSTDDPDFEAGFRALSSDPEQRDSGIEKSVRDIVDDVRLRGDAALLDYTRQFDRHDERDDPFVPEDEMNQQSSEKGLEEYYEERRPDYEAAVPMQLLHVKFKPYYEKKKVHPKIS